MKQIRWVAVVLLMSGCMGANELSALSDSTEGNEMFEKRPIHVSKMKPVNSCSVHGDLGVYEEMFLSPKSNDKLTISSSRYSPEGEVSFEIFFSTDEDMKKEDVYGLCPFLRDVETKELYGKRLCLKPYSSFPGTRATEIDSLYIPDVVHITSPVSSGTSMPPLCYYDDFVVRWEKDDFNENGVVIGISWSGLMVFGEDYHDTQVYRIECVPDSGVAHLDSSMFNGIPDTAYCQMVVLRGNYDEIENEDEVIRVIAESHDVLHFVLVRNVKYL